ncbi:hypothetical protein ABZU75_07855 [Streptosporangium sp. NPDC005286]|uniref:hypothetical protein n=1 Tax=Streptosporangium sp. NPDC005286 TaxID=3154463 RepID=UPI0033B7214E
MSNRSTPVLNRTTASGCGCFAEAPPMPMGCAVCGHAPYAHGCPRQTADHEYAQPSGELMAERLDVRRQFGLGRTLPTFEPAHEVTAQPTPLVPAPRQAERETALAHTRPAGRTDTRRPVMPSAHPHRPVETQENRAARLALARDPRARRRARVAARAHEPAPHSGAPSLNVGQEARRLRHAEPIARPPLTPVPGVPDVAPHPPHQTLPPGLAVTPGRDHSPDAPLSWRQHPHWQEVAA